MTIRKKLDEILKASKQPIAIFDLDGTVFDVVYRTMEIMRRFLALPEIRTRFPEQVASAAKLRHQDYHYGLETTLNAIGIDRYSEHSAHFIHAAETFWYKHFFIDELLAFDVPYAGALACVKQLKHAGVQIVYLSGRDIPNMSQGTLCALDRHGFPHTGHGISICLKPAYGLDDLLFKKQSIESISTLGEVILTLDNEPANVQLFADRFPKALHIHFNTHYAKPLELKGHHIHVIKSFGELGYADESIDH